MPFWLIRFDQKREIVGRRALDQGSLYTYQKEKVASMDFNDLLKSLRVNAKLSRTETVKLLSNNGIRTSTATLTRIENGKYSKPLELILGLLRIYHARGSIKPGMIETAFLCRSTFSLDDRRRRYIAANLDACSEKELAAIEQLINKALHPEKPPPSK